jgi:DNA-binding HxlR family transcriptional regulator
MLEEEGIIKKQYDAARKTKTKYIYLLTPKGLDLIPLLFEIMLWSEDHEPKSGLFHLPLVEKARHNKQQVINELRETVIARINKSLLSH